MAQVTLQAVVNFEQVNQLQQKIDKLNGQKITIGVQDFSKQLQDADKSLSSVNDNLTKTVRVFNADGELTKGVDEFERGVATTVRVTHKLNEETGELEKTQTRVSRNLKKEQREAAKAQEAHTEEVKKGNDEVKKQGLLYDILGRSVSSFLARMTVYRAVYAGIRAVTNGFQEAIQTLRAVDDELVTVRKVTGFDQYQMAGVENQAYAVASKYGASASDYVSGVASFARAGYKELSGDLAELAQKTVIVGDTTAEIANQFLLSVDAAYKYNGSVRELSKVLDAANELDNKYATSIEKIAEGMGIVAPVAAQMHVGVNELAAAIGTVTAVTQRSGTEAARALRALFLNIVGDTKTEIDEGVTWTTGEIAGLKDVLRKYSPEAVKAAEATGRIIDPMEAIGGLAQSMKEGTLKEQELMEMVSDIGGKLRTSQLLALIQNWDMYNNMLRDTENAAGSADKEIANAMDSWTRKTNVLKNTWTEFIKSGLNSGQIKFLLDALTWIIKHLGTLNGAVIRLGTALAALKLFSTARELTQISKGLLDVKNGASKAARMFTEMGVSAKALNVASGIIGGLTLAWTAYTAIQAEIERKHQERVQAIYNEAEAAKESAGNVLDLYVEMDKAADSASDFTSQAKTLADTLGIDLAEGADKARQKIAELSAEELRRSADKANTAYITAQDEYLRSHGKGAVIDAMWNLYNARNVQYLLEDIPSNLRDRIQGVYSSLPISTAERTAGTKTFALSIIPNMEIDKALKFRDAMQEIIDIRDEYIRQGGDQAVLDSKYFTSIEEYLGETSEAFSALEKARKDAIDTQAMELFQKAVTSSTVQSKEDLDELISRFQGARNVSEEVREKLVELANKYYDFSDAAEKATDSTERQTVALNENEKALDKNATSEERAAAAKKDAEAAARLLIPALWDESGALSATGVFALEADKNLAGMVQSELEAQLAAKQANYSTLVAQLAMVGITAAQAAQQIYQISVALSGGNPATAGAMFGAFMASGGGNDAQALLNAKMAEIKRLMSQLSSISAYSGGSSGGGSGSGHSGSGHSGGGSGSGHSGSGHSGGGSSSSSNEDKKLTALKDRVSLLKSELSLMKERGDSEEDQIDKMREIQKALRKEYKYLKSIKGDQITINNLYQEWYSYANQISDLEGKAADEAQKHADAIQAAVEAQKALDNILKNRSVRVYNAATGQWEWQADPAAVASAQSDLNNAIAGTGYTQDAWALLYSALSGIASIKDNWLNSGPGAVSNAFGGNSYGNTYNFGRISLSEVQAQNMTVAEFARLANALPAFNNSP